jgi:hypothetical protein
MWFLSPLIPARPVCSQPWHNFVRAERILIILPVRRTEKESEETMMMMRLMVVMSSGPMDQKVRGMGEEADVNQVNFCAR